MLLARCCSSFLLPREEKDPENSHPNEVKKEFAQKRGDEGMKVNPFC